MASISKKAREQRMRAVVDPSDIVSDKVYNLVMGLVVFWGILVNVIICNMDIDLYTVIRSEYAPIIVFVGYLVLVFAGIAIAKKSNNPIVSFIGYNMVVVPMGFVISMAVRVYGGVDSPVVTLAFLYTLIITSFMILTAVLFPQFYAKIGKVLLVCLIGIIVCSIIAVIFGSGNYVFLSVLGAAVFSLYIGYDFYRSQQFPKTIDNAVDCALDIYVDIANLFLEILRILGEDN